MCRNMCKVLLSFSLLVRETFKYIRKICMQRAVLQIIGIYGVNSRMIFVSSPSNYDWGYTLEWPR